MYGIVAALAENLVVLRDRFARADETAELLNAASTLLRRGTRDMVSP